MSGDTPDIDDLAPLHAEMVKSELESSKVLYDGDLLACDYHPDEKAVWMQQVLLQDNDPDDQASAVVMYGRTKLKAIKQDAEADGVEFGERLDQHTQERMQELKRDAPDTLQVIHADQIQPRKPILGDNVTVVCENCMQAYENPQIETCPHCGASVQEYETAGKIETDDNQREKGEEKVLELTDFDSDKHLTVYDDGTIVKHDAGWITTHEYTGFTVVSIDGVDDKDAYIEDRDEFRSEIHRLFRMGVKSAYDRVVFEEFEQIELVDEENNVTVTVRLEGITNEQQQSER